MESQQRIEQIVVIVLLVVLAVAAVFILPLAAAGTGLADSVAKVGGMIAVLLKQGPPDPPAWVAELPIVGPQLTERWLDLERLGAGWTAELQPYLDTGLNWSDPPPPSCESQARFGPSRQEPECVALRRPSMTLDQAIAFAIILGTIGLLIWDRIRYDLVALLALLASVACGIVPATEAFRGFSDDIVIIVGSALVVSAAIGRSGLVETLMKPLVPRMRISVMQVAVLGSAVTALSAFVKNIGALAIFIPIALQVARRTEKPASRVLMPLAFGSLLGGLVTLIGTSPNVIVSRMREQMTGEPFRMFDFAPVGIGLAVVGLIFLTLGWRLLPPIKRGAGATPETRFSIEDYITEVRLPAASPYVGKTVRDLEALGDGDVTVAAVIREGYRRYIPAGYWRLFEGDILVLEADTHALSKLVDAAKLELIHGKKLAPGDAREEDLAVVEAVVTANSALIGSTVEQLALRERYGLNLLALSRSGRRIAQRLRRVRFQDGDLLVLQGRAERINDKLAALGCLPLAERNVPLGRTRNLYLPAVVLGVAMVLVTTDAIRVSVGFFGAAVAVLVLQLLTLKEAYDAVEWPVLVLFGALIPVSEALQMTGATDLVASWLSAAAQHLPPLGALGMMMIAAMALTPFLNNAATVLVMAPIGASLAGQLGLSPDSFLMAVAVGAGCDFLTPIGHQCNTLVMGPGGYRFSDYWRLGLPLSLIVAVLGTFLISWFWPLS